MSVLPPSPPSSYEQDILELRDTNARLQEQIENLKVSEQLLSLFSLAVVA